MAFFISGMHYCTSLRAFAFCLSFLGAVVLQYLLPASSVHLLQHNYALLSSKPISLPPKNKTHRSIMQTRHAIVCLCASHAPSRPATYRTPPPSSPTPSTTTTTLLLRNPTLAPCILYDSARTVQYDTRPAAYCTVYRLPPPFLALTKPSLHYFH